MRNLQELDDGVNGQCLSESVYLHSSVYKVFASIQTSV